MTESNIYVNWPGLITVMIILLPFGLIAVISPITVSKIFMRWPKFIFPRLFNESQLRPQTRDALYLIDNDLEGFANQFWYQLLLIRVTGLIALVIFGCGLFGIFIALDIF